MTKKKGRQVYHCPDLLPVPRIKVTPTLLRCVTSVPPCEHILSFFATFASFCSISAAQQDSTPSSVLSVSSCSIFCLLLHVHHLKIVHLPRQVDMVKQRRLAIHRRE